MELWDIYDRDRQLTGRTHERGQAMADGDYHLVVHVWIINSRGQILVSKRHPAKPHPNLWECTGGSVLAGETSLHGAWREVKEELGIDLTADSGELIRSERRDWYHDFYDVWLFQQEVDLAKVVCQPEEVTAVKLVTRSELEQLYRSGQLCPTLSYYNSIFAPDLKLATAVDRI